MTTKRHYVMVGARRVAVYTERSNGNADTRYMHHDHQGSLDAITDEAGNVLERFSFDAFGKPRLASWSPDPVGQLFSTVTTRGYTGHEHLQGFALIHMNGRMYDPTLGRFLSADPYVTTLANPQDLNRYSYVINNPLRYTDPSGYSRLSRSLRRLGRSVRRLLENDLVRAAVAVAALVYRVDILNWAGRLGQSAVGSAAVGRGAVGGALIGYVSTGTVRGTITGGISGAAFGMIGDYASTNNWGLPATSLAHGVSGGALSELQGGEFRHGFWSAGIARLLGPVYPSDPVAQGVARAIVGGALSRASGGKFSNGAMTAAYAYLFNDLGHVEDEKGRTVGGLGEGLRQDPSGSEMLSAVSLTIFPAALYHGGWIAFGQLTLDVAVEVSDLAVFQDAQAVGEASIMAIAEANAALITSPRAGQLTLVRNPVVHTVVLGAAQLAPVGYQYLIHALDIQRQ